MKVSLLDFMSKKERRATLDVAPSELPWSYKLRRLG
jgi:hypothetical protein